MKRSTTAIAGAVAGVLALAVFATSHAAADAKPDVEKCYGVAKAGKNDCQTATSACAGTTKKNAQKDAWISVPKGTCEKIVGASLKASK